MVILRWISVGCGSGCYAFVFGVEITLSSSFKRFIRSGIALCAVRAEVHPCGIGISKRVVKRVCVQVPRLRIRRFNSAQELVSVHDLGGGLRLHGLTGGGRLRMGRTGSRRQSDSANGPNHSSTMPYAPQIQLGPGKRALLQVFRHQHCRRKAEAEPTFR